MNPRRYSYTRTISFLRYFAASPPPEHGGFDCEVVKVSQAAIYYLTNLRRSKHNSARKAGNERVRVSDLTWMHNHK